ncbi:hypothetical protein ACER0C_005396 [Sarotherodon galilaeus]
MDTSSLELLLARIMLAWRLDEVTMFCCENSVYLPLLESQVSSSSSGIRHHAPISPTISPSWSSSRSGGTDTDQQSVPNDNNSHLKLLNISFQQEDNWRANQICRRSICEMLSVHGGGQEVDASISGPPLPPVAMTTAVDGGDRGAEGGGVGVGGWELA